MFGFLALSIIPLLLGALALGGFGADTDNDDDTEANPDLLDRDLDQLFPRNDAEDDERDIGATLTEQEDGSYTLDIGEDETGTVYAVRTEIENFASADDSQTTDFDLTFYLVPEGVDLEAVIEDNFEDLDILPTVLSEAGAEELATFDLGQTQLIPEGTGEEDTGGPVFVDTRLPAPIVTGDIAGLVVLEASGATDGDGVIVDTVTETSDLGAGNDVFPGARLVINASFPGQEIIGTDGDDTLDAAFDRDAIDSDDFTVTPLDDVTIQGGAGDDVIDTIFSGYFYGDDGNDTLTATEGYYGYDSTMRLYGGAGNDMLAAYVSQDAAVVFLDGGDGDDTIDGDAFVGGLTARGGDGDDVISVSYYAARAEGGNGNDTITASLSAPADGGAGDDLIVSSVLPDDFTGSGRSGPLTGGSGSDTFLIQTRVSDPDSEGVVFDRLNVAQITDYDRNDDAIQLEILDGSTVSNVTVTSDGSDSVVSYNLTLGSDMVRQVIVVEGVPDLDTDDLEIITT